ncbi:Alpha-aminoadipic semialdehyde synthase mitochondrial [Fasciola gigantica]|uniref:Alpha-aminoadipic semialdehyde synthase mitochondrial n=1 Tax=Fasciola gigantica TaxID=46835 RepID=A0A504Z3L9_FASGI|nr:Alpha-aminoadipic semialdehyde synthase mitochondrial [Fasciola gigantica]
MLHEPFENFNAAPEVKNAVITSNGSLTERFKYIDGLRSQKRQSTTVPVFDKRVLVLGSGYVVPPLIEYLSRDKKIHMTVVSNAEKELVELTERFPRISTRQMNVLENEKAFGELMSQNDLVISLVPWKYHPQVAQQCIKQKKNLLTASYCTPTLKEMEPEFIKAGITAFMEMGLDPGIDHLLTKECIDDVKEQNGRVVSYRSFTGGVPAPENSNNPLRYKFSWSPEAAMSTVMNGARYLEDGQVRT